MVELTFLGSKVDGAFETLTSRATAENFITWDVSMNDVSNGLQCTNITALPSPTKKDWNISVNLECLNGTGAGCNVLILGVI